MKKIIQTVFDATVNSYENILKTFIPAFKNRFTERNLTFNFSHNYLERNLETIVWQEFPLIKEGTNTRSEHLDTLIIDKKNEALIFIEAKSIPSDNRVKLRIEQISKDLDRMVKISINPQMHPELPDYAKDFKRFQLLIFDLWKPNDNGACSKLIDELNDSHLEGFVSIHSEKIVAMDIKPIQNSKLSKGYYICYVLYEINPEA